MDDEQDDYREPEERDAAEMRAESEERAETEDRESLGGIEEPPVSEEPEEPAYTPEEYLLAQEIKSKRLYKEEHSRFPQTAGELSYFLMKADIERPIRPDDEDLQAARRKLEAAGS
jgi:hypothetical protein